MPHLFSNPLAWLIAAFIAITFIGYLYLLLGHFRSRSPDVRLAQRQAEERRLNEGWRIPLISTGTDQSLPSTRSKTLWGGPIILLLLVGFLLEVNDDGNSYLPGILIVSALLAIGLLIFFRGQAIKRQRAGWIVVPARCTDREIRQVATNDFNDQATWLCRLVCEFDHNGQHYRITPIAHRRFSRADECDFPTQEQAQAFLSSKVATDGGCSVRINPNNPLQGELC
jgi:hypothetical protein